MDNYLDLFASTIVAQTEGSNRLSLVLIIPCLSLRFVKDISRVLEMWYDFYTEKGPG